MGVHVYCNAFKNIIYHEQVDLPGRTKVLVKFCLLKKLKIIKEKCFSILVEVTMLDLRSQTLNDEEAENKPKEKKKVR